MNLHIVEVHDEGEYRQKDGKITYFRKNCSAPRWAPNALTIGSCSSMPGNALYAYRICSLLNLTTLQVYCYNCTSYLIRLIRLMRLISLNCDRNDTCS